MCNFNAARETFSVSATEMKYRRCRSSTGVNGKLQMIDVPAYYKTCVPGNWLFVICHLRFVILSFELSMPIRYAQARNIVLFRSQGDDRQWGHESDQNSRIRGPGSTPVRRCGSP